MRRVVVAVVLAVSVVTAGCADDGGSASQSPTTAVGSTTPSRLIEIVMRDYSFEPAALTARAGETVTLRFINKGTVRHEAVIGDEAVQIAHAQMMASMATTTVTAKLSAFHVGDLRAHPGMNAPNVISVEAGATGDVTYSLAKKAHLLIGCHEIGHYERGMVATLDVI
ncbi:MAG: hypothetical protein U0Q22_05940 [Acidimicrobiales bacterium]